MKKIILYLLLILVSFSTYAQKIQRTNNYGNGFKRLYADSLFAIPYTDTLNPPNVVAEELRPGLMVYRPTDLKTYIYNGIKWSPIEGDTSGGGDVSYNGNRSITLAVSGFNGVTPGGTTIQEFLDNLFYPTQPPTSALTITYNGNTNTSHTLEYMSAGADLNATANWTATRQAQTAPIASIVVNGVSQSFSQPSAPGSVSGTQAFTFPRNATKNVTNLVTTTDSKTSSITRTISFQYKRYWFYSSSTTPSDAEIIAAAGGNNEFSSSRAKSTFSIVVTGSSQYLHYVYVSTAGDLTSLSVGGFESLPAFTKSTKTFTNSFGGSYTVNIYTSNNTFTNTTVSNIVTN